MADSTAKNYYQFMNEAVPQTQTPVKRQTKTQTKKRMIVDPRSVPFNRFEKIIVTIGCIVTAAMMLILITFSNAATSSQRQLQNVNTAVANKKGHNTDLEQEIGELTSTERINKIAKQQGLQLIESNIRTIR